MRISIKKTVIGFFSLALIATAAFSFHIIPGFSQTTPAPLTPAQQAALQAELTDIENQITQQQAILTEKEGEGKSISRDIAILDAQIAEAQLKIKAHNLAIAQLGKDITVKVQTINTLSSQIDQGHQSLSEIIDQTNQLDSFSIADAFLAQRNLTDFFIDFDALSSIQDSLSSLLGTVKQAEAQTEVQKQSLDQQKNQEIDTKVNIEQEQANIKKAEADKKQLLSLNKQQQSQYQNLIAQKEAQATQIRNALFQLRDVSAIKFEDALTYAKSASAITGVRPAFILAIIQQESNLGANVGSCYLSDDTTGAGVKVSSGAAVANVMKPGRDIEPFIEITTALGRDSHHTRVSCPFSVGYGGAMGPAQFIASTWMLSKDRIGHAVGKAMPDPWNPQDAITASALYLSDLGASAGGYTAEHNAACRYYSGRNCSGSNTFYGDQVIAKATAIQSNIDILQQP